MIIHIDKPLPPQPPEKEEGNKEYKRYLKCKTNYQKEFIEKRASQMLYRLIEGEGNAIYMLGVDDDGKIYSLDKKIIDETIKNLKLIAEKIDASINVVRIYKNNVLTVRIKLSPMKLKNIQNGLYN